MRHQLKLTRLERSEALLEQFRSLQAAGAQARLETMRLVVDQFAELSRRPTVAFNMLDVLRVGADEVIHSGVLAWLLDARGGHGQGPLLFKPALPI